MAKPKFSGELAKPFRRKKPPGLLASDKEREQYTRKESERESERWVELLHKLLDHYDISRTDRLCWGRLSVYLAQECVPGFKTLKEPGAPTIWGPEELFKLMMAIEKTIVPGDHTKGVSWAAAQLVKHEPWKTLTAEKKKTAKTRKPAEVLRTRYYYFYRVLVGHPLKRAKRSPLQER